MMREGYCFHAAQYGAQPGLI